MPDETNAGSRRIEPLVANGALSGLMLSTCTQPLSGAEIAHSNSITCVVPSASSLTSTCPLIQSGFDGTVVNPTSADWTCFLDGPSSGA